MLLSRNVPKRSYVLQGDGCSTPTPECRNRVPCLLLEGLKRSAFLVWLFGRQLGDTKVTKLFAEGLNTLVHDQEPPEIVSNYSPVESTCTLASMLTAEIKSSNARAVFVVIPDIRPDTRIIDEKPEYPAIRACLSRLDAQVLDLTEVLSRELADDAITLPGIR